MAKSFIKSQSATTLADLVGIRRKPLAHFSDEPELMAGPHAGAAFRLPGLGRPDLVERKADTEHSPTPGHTVKIKVRPGVKFRVVVATKAARPGGKTK
jgi:hypothetical protein